MKLNDLLLSKSIDRVFVFQSLSRFNDTHINYIKHELNNCFFSNWYSHSDKISPKLLLLHHHFIIISACMPNISGCAIDALTHKMKEIESNLGFSLFNRIKIPYFKHSSSNFTYHESDDIYVKFLSYQDFVSQYRDNQNANISILNTRASYSDELWLLPLDLWMKDI